jgi:protein required for attachment to host cells
MSKATHWILIAGSTSATIYAADARLDGLEPAAQLHHPAGRLQARDLVTDDRGRTQAFPGGAKSATEGRQSLHQNEVHVFAHEIALRLRKGHLEHEFEGLVLVAPPAMLGQLRLELDVHTSERVVASIPHDYTQAPLAELPGMLRKRVLEGPTQEWSPNGNG